MTEQRIVDGVTRLHFAGGWTSLTAKSGKQRLERISDVAESARALGSVAPAVSPKASAGAPALKQAVAKLQEAQKTEKKKGQQFQAVVHYLNASRQLDAVAAAPTASEKQRAALKKNKTKADQAIQRLMAKLTADELEALSAMEEESGAEPARANTDPNSLEIMAGEDTQTYAARRARLQDEAKARTAAKFGDAGLAEQHLEQRQQASNAQPEPAAAAPPLPARSSQKRRDQRMSRQEALHVARPPGYWPAAVEASDTDEGTSDTGDTSVGAVDAVEAQVQARPLPGPTAGSSLALESERAMVTPRPVPSTERAMATPRPVPSTAGSLAANNEEVQRLRTDLETAQRQTDVAEQSLRRAQQDTAAANSARREADARLIQVEREGMAAAAQVAELRAQNAQLSDDLSAASSSSHLGDEARRHQRRADEAEQHAAQLRRQLSDALADGERTAKSAATEREDHARAAALLREELANATEMKAAGSARLQSVESELAALRQKLASSEEAASVHAQEEHARLVAQEEGRYAQMRDSYEAQLGDYSKRLQDSDRVKADNEHLKARLEQATASTLQAEQARVALEQALQLTKTQLAAAEQETAALRAGMGRSPRALPNAPGARALPSLPNVDGAEKVAEAEKQLAEALRAGEAAVQRERASAAAAADTAARVLAKSKAELARVRDEMAQQSEERDSDRRELRRLRSAVSAAGSLEEELAQRVSAVKREAAARGAEEKAKADAEARRCKQALTLCEEEAEALRGRLRQSKDELERERSRSKTSREELESELRRERSRPRPASPASASVPPMSAQPLNPGFPEAVTPPRMSAATSTPAAASGTAALASSAVAAPAGDSLAARIRELALLKDEGVISAVEFSQGKVSLLEQTVGASVARALRPEMVAESPAEATESAERSEMQSRAAGILERQRQRRARRGANAASRGERRGAPPPPPSPKSQTHAQTPLAASASWIRSYERLLAQPK